MVVEWIQYHATKRPYHGIPAPLIPQGLPHKQKRPDEAVNNLLEFYTACSQSYHTLLRMGDEGNSAPGLASSPDIIFIESIRGATRRAGDIGYLSRKAKASTEWDGGDMNFFFDRHIARLPFIKSPQY